MQKYGFVYLWLDRKNKRYYVGSHWGHVDDGYVCSSRWMRNAYKRRPEDFKRRIISKVTTSKADLLVEEGRWLQMIKPEELKVRYYNMNATTKPGHWFAIPGYDKTISEKISIRTKEAMADPEIRKKYDENYRKADRKLSDPETRRKRSESMKKTMAEKFPVENRWKKLTPEERKHYYSEKAKKMHAARKARQ